MFVWQGKLKKEIQQNAQHFKNPIGMLELGILKHCQEIFVCHNFVIFLSFYTKPIFFFWKHELSDHF